MSYNEYTWQTGETITAEKLNNLEEGVQEALEGGDAGYSYTKTSTLLTEESVTTSGSTPYITATLSYSTPIDASFLTVTFEDADYELDKVDLDYGIAYGDWQEGAPDFTNYPLVILSSNGVNTIFTETAGTYQVKIESVAITATPTKYFKKAVEVAYGKMPKKSDFLKVHFTDRVDSITASATNTDITNALLDDKLVVGGNGDYGYTLLERRSDTYGAFTYHFGFTWWDGSNLKYTRYSLKWDDTVEKIEKIITTTNV